MRLRYAFISNYSYDMHSLANRAMHASTSPSHVQVKDLLAEYPAFQQYRRNGLDLDFQYYLADSLPQNVQDWAFALCKSNMEAIYNTSWGWSDTDKREELTAPEARFLVAYDKV